MLDPTSDAPGQILAQWREAERRLESLEAGTPDWHRTRLEVAELAAAYQKSLADREDEAKDLGGPVIGNDGLPAAALNHG